MLLFLCLVADVIILMFATHMFPDRCYILWKKIQEIPVPVPEPLPVPILKHSNTLLKKILGLSVPVPTHVPDFDPSMILKLLLMKSIELYRPVVKNTLSFPGANLSVGKTVRKKHQEVRAAMAEPVPVPLHFTLTFTFYRYHLHILQQISREGPVPVPVSVPVPVPLPSLKPFCPVAENAFFFPGMILNLGNTAVKINQVAWTRVAATEPVPLQVNLPFTFYSCKLHILFAFLPSSNHFFKELLLNVAVPLPVPLHFTFYTSYFTLKQTSYFNSLHILGKISLGGSVTVLVPVFVPVPVPAPLPLSKLLQAVGKYKKKDI